MRLTETEIAELTEGWRKGKLYIEDIGPLLASHESLRTDLVKIESGNIRLWKENEELKGNLKMAVQVILTMFTDDQLKDIKELGELARLEIARTIKEGKQ